MALTPVEIIAWIVIIGALVKMIILAISPKTWMNFVKKYSAKVAIIQLVSFILAAVVLYFLLEELTIVQIVAVVAFTGLLIMFGLATHIDYLLKKYRAQIKNGTMWKENGLYALVWLILLVWAGKELLAM